MGFIKIMDNKTLQCAAKILVEQGYAHAEETDKDIWSGRVSISKFDQPKTPDGGYHGTVVLVAPLSDTLEGRRQADAIEDWFWHQENSLWKRAAYAVRDNITCNENQHQWRLDRIKFCLEKL